MDGFKFRSLFARKLAKKVATKKRIERRNSERTSQIGATVLIVDDSRTALHVLTTVLEKAGYAVLTASNGEQGIQLAKLYLPDIIFMDVVMPGINGFRATRLLRKDASTENIPIVIVSGKEQPTDKFWGLRLGANDFLAKPISRGSLFGALDNLLKQSPARLP